MRLARKLALIAMAAVAAMALSATSASAQFEVSKEEPREPVKHCDPCHFWAHGEEGLTTTITQHMGGVETIVSACHDEFEGVIGEDGEGVVTFMDVQGPPGVCNAVPCADAGGQVPWPFHLREHYNHEEEIEITFCLFDATGQFSFCTIDPHFEDVGGHHYEIRAVSEKCHDPGQSTTVEVDGHWLLNGEHLTGDNIEIVHL